jgi:hypothetical protein
MQFVADYHKIWEEVAIFGSNYPRMPVFSSYYIQLRYEHLPMCITSPRIALQNDLIIPRPRAQQ